MDSQEKVPPGWIKVKSKTRPDRHYFYHKEKKISVWKIEDCKDESKINIAKSSQEKTPKKTPKKSPKKESKLSSHSIVIGKRNIADERMKKLQCNLRKEVERGKLDSNKNNIKGASTAKPASKKKDLVETLSSESTKQIKEVTEKCQEEIKKAPLKVIENIQEYSTNSSFINDLNGTNNTTCTYDKDESIQMEIDEQQLDRSTDSLKDYLEPMDWEDIDEKFVLQEISSIRTKEQHAAASFDSHNVGTKLTKNNFYIIVDTNVLISNLPFVREIKSKQFKDIGRAYIYLPYIVLCELDRLKLREENISRLARTAISFIDECFKNKDEFLLGQSAIESSKELIEIDSGDDYIINCGLQMKEYTSKIIVLSNDKNLRNKAFVNRIEAFSSDMLNYADYNIANKIKFE